MTEITNPLLEALRFPGATFRLPSQGLFYDDGELSEDVKNGEVEVYPMTAMEEIVLATPDKLMSGKAIMEVFARCIPQIKKPGQLLAKDVDYLMVALRSVTFGDAMEVMFRHDCEGGLVHSYQVDIQQLLRETKQLDPTTLTTEYTHTMPNGQVVVLKPMTYSDVTELYKVTAMLSEDDLSQQEAEKLIIDTLASVIKKVDQVVDNAFIRQWLTKISLGWKRQLESIAKNATQWGIEFSSHHICQDCNKPIEIHVSPNPVSFFT